MTDSIPSELPGVGSGVGVGSASLLDVYPASSALKYVSFFKKFFPEDNAKYIGSESIPSQFSCQIDAPLGRLLIRFSALAFSEATKYIPYLYPVAELFNV